MNLSDLLIYGDLFGGGGSGGSSGGGNTVMYDISGTEEQILAKYPVDATISAVGGGTWCKLSNQAYTEAEVKEGFAVILVDDNASVTNLLSLSDNEMVESEIDGAIIFVLPFLNAPDSSFSVLIVVPETFNAEDVVFEAGTYLNANAGRMLYYDSTDDDSYDVYTKRIIIGFGGTKI